VLGPGLSKLTDRVVLGVFLGYELRTKGYRIYDPMKNKLMITRDVVFDEQKPWNWEGDGTSVTVAAESKLEFPVQ
jgi:hypothetical protein